MRDRLRLELGDTGEVKVWSDGLLDDLLVEGAAWYSRLFPMHATAYRDITLGQRVVVVPPGAVGVTQVECPPGRILPQEASGASGSAGSTGQQQGWNVWGGTIYLTNPAGGGEVGAGRLVMRLLLPWDRPDPTDDWNGPEDDERLLILWAATEAWTWLDGQDRKRGRPGRNDDMAARYNVQLEHEVSARKRAAGSRALEVG